MHNELLTLAYLSFISVYLTVHLFIYISVYSYTFVSLFISLYLFVFCLSVYLHCFTVVNDVVCHFCSRISWRNAGSDSLRRETQG